VRMLFNSIPISLLDPMELYASPQTEFQVIGYIIPGLMAIWFDRQGWVETMCTLLTAAVVIRLTLVLIFGVELQMQGV